MASSIISLPASNLRSGICLPSFPRTLVCLVRKAVESESAGPPIGLKRFINGAGKARMLCGVLLSNEPLAMRFAIREHDKLERRALPTVERSLNIFLFHNGAGTTCKNVGFNTVIHLDLTIASSPTFTPCSHFYRYPSVMSIKSASSDTTAAAPTKTKSRRLLVLYAYVKSKKTMRCNHLFHKVCLDRWLGYSYSSTCPVCRTLLTPAKLVADVEVLVFDCFGFYSDHLRDSWWLR
ncbi:Ubiquitin-like superfamily protein [Hibiscus syriacus]|uniref:Ubiquitin-like superfamily protein n=1 Tax=Hibiscus syriacus TaxID=106335 RepID=A0A6A3B2N7_HIBSY|nr:Ubiquitin-like superfamily protein [Hibiscus syriacus]